MIELIIPALLPAVADGFKKVVGKFTGDTALTVEDRLALNKADVERLQALASLDSVNNASIWANNVRALQRPVAVVAVLGVYGYAVLSGQDATVLEQAGSFAQMAVFYLFGDRSYAKLKGN